MLGAMGFTGRLVVAELARRGLPHRAGARSSSPPVDVTDPSSLAAFVEGAGVVVNTVGPFADHGLAVVGAAVRAGAAYVDCSGELDFMRDVLRRFRDAPVPVVVACGFQAVPGVLGAAVAVADAGGDPDAIHVHYSARMLPSRGTAKTLVRELTAAGRPSVRGGGLEMPLAETVLLPHAYPAARVHATVAVPAPRLAARALPLVRRLAPVVRALPAGPPPFLRRRDRARVSVVATGSGGSAAFAADLRDTYGLTARFLVEAALTLQGTGAMSPAQAVVPERFLDAVSGSGPTGSFAWRRVPAAGR